MFRRLRSLFGRREVEPARPYVAGRAWDTDRRLVAILFRIYELHDRGTRQELVFETGRRLGEEFSVPQNDDARAHLRAIVRTAQSTGTLKELRDALKVIVPDDIMATWFALAVTVLTSPPSATGVPADLMLDLVWELRAHQPEGFARTAVHQYLVERSTEGRPLHARTLPQVLGKLYDARVPATDPAAPRTDVRRFLRLLTDEPGGSKRLAALLARALDGNGSEDRSAAAAVPPSSVKRQVIIQIRVEEEGAPDVPPSRRRYSLRGYHYERVDDAKPVFLGSRDVPELYTGEELASSGCGFLAAWKEPADAARDVSKRVEFLLPHSLLGSPLDSWQVDEAGVPVGHSCQVVVRSLTRYQNSWTHDEWFRRWKTLDRDCVPGDALERIGWMGKDESAGPWSCPIGTYPPLRLTRAGDVADWLSTHDDLCCLGLGASYDDQLIRKAVDYALLWDGIPVMVWRRGASGDPRPLLDVLRGSGPPARLTDLPNSVYRARRRGRDADSVHNQITLLWDDPTLVFHGQDRQMSGTRGAGEGEA
ncbi:VMAP-C domain-containing protein [Streptomyces coeruleorubidus]|uniref:VMAP-C domain-containing protein n=1 Tax=Streptomyces coeruleorubidus TaxID=116188 RepID=UPI00366473E4